MPASQIIIDRTSPDDVQDRQIYVNLDGTPIATLLYGRSVTTELAPGPHTLLADNTLKKKTVEFTAQAGEQIHFRVVSRPGWAYVFLVGFFGAAPVNLSIERVST